MISSFRHTQADLLIEMLEQGRRQGEVATVEAGHGLTEADLATTAAWIDESVG